MGAVSIYDIVVPGNVIAYWDNRKADQTKYMADSLFPAVKQLGTELTKIGGRDGVPVALKASTFDVQTTFRDRIATETRTQNLPYFKEGYKVDEKTRQQINIIAASGNADILDPIVRHIFDDTNNLLRGAKATRERMAMQLISTGKIFVESNGLDLEYDYGIDEDYQKTAPATNWNDTENATPLKDMYEWVNDFRIHYGVNLGFAVMNSKTFNYIISNKAIIKQMYPNSNDPSGLFVQPAAVVNLIEQVVGVRIAINDNMYATAVRGANKKFFPDNVVSFLPDNGVLGNMVFGTTPAESDLMTGNLIGAQASITDTGVAVLTRQITDPVTIETIVSQTCMPAFGSDVEGGAGAILIANVVK